MIDGCVVFWKVSVRVSDAEDAANLMQFLRSLDKEEFFAYLANAFDGYDTEYSWDEEEVDDSFHIFENLETALDYTEREADLRCAPIKYVDGYVVFFTTDLRVYDEEYDDYFLLYDLDDSYSVQDCTFSNVYQG